MEDINREAEVIEIINEEKFPKNISMKIVDFNQTFGVFIDREENRAK